MKEVYLEGKILVWRVVKSPILNIVLKYHMPKCTFSTPSAWISLTITSSPFNIQKYSEHYSPFDKPRISIHRLTHNCSQARLYYASIALWCFECQSRLAHFDAHEGIILVGCNPRRPYKKVTAGESIPRCIIKRDKVTNNGNHWCK